MNVILDLDGVIWLSEEPIDGSSEAVDRLRDAGQRVLFLTNNSYPTVDTLVDKLRGMRVDVRPEDICTSSQAAASLVDAGERVLVCGGPGVVQALEARGAEPVRDGEADAVIVGYHRDFDYDRLTAAFRAVAGGARLIGTNDDPTYPTPDGPIPGGGSLLAAVATAAGVEPTVAGKPHQAMADLVRERLGAGDDGPLEGTTLVGDRPSTDGLMAKRLSVPFVLVLTGVTSNDDASAEGVDAAEVAPNLAAWVAAQEFA
jgi:4-nitrophenyl phosphatase